MESALKDNLIHSFNTSIIEYTIYRPKYLPYINLRIPLKVYKLRCQNCTCLQPVINLSFANMPKALD